MKRILALCIALCAVMTGFAQEDTTGRKTTTGEGDTIIVGGMVIIRSGNAEDASRRRVVYRTRKKAPLRNISTNWAILDLGVSNYVDNTVYGPGTDADQYAPGSNASWFDLRNGKSINVNVWIVTQKLNLVKHVVNLKYGIGLELNNYRYKQPIRYDANPPATPNPPIVSLDPLAGVSRTYRKDKLAADYLTAPLMLNFNFTPHRLRFFGLSAGVSAGFLYSARNKTITSDEGKKKAKDDFDLNRWKLAYVGELSLGVIKFYGSYAFKSMYKRGLDITPYSVGFRISNW